MQRSVSGGIYKITFKELPVIKTYILLYQTFLQSELKLRIHFHEILNIPSSLSVVSAYNPSLCGDSIYIYTLDILCFYVYFGIFHRSGAYCTIYLHVMIV